jgi:septal ring factor EnvC (AmiA/AmiB activator)
VASGVAIYLALDAGDDTATKSDLNEVRTKVTSVEQSALRAAADDVAAFGDEIGRLERMIRSHGTAARRSRSELKVAGDDIDDLRKQIADLSDQLADLEAEVATKADEEGPGGRSGA